VQNGAPCNKLQLPELKKWSTGGSLDSGAPQGAPQYQGISTCAGTAKSIASFFTAELHRFSGSDFAYSSVVDTKKRLCPRGARFAASRGEINNNRTSTLKRKR